MKSDQGSTSPTRDERLQAEFEGAAEDLGLRLEEAPTPDPKCAVGIALVIGGFMDPITDFEPSHDKDTTDRDDRAIRETITAWESASPEEIPVVWSDLAVQPFVGFGASYLVSVTREGVIAALESERFQEQLRLYPLYDPRHVEVTNFEIVYMGAVKAVVTYRVQESYTNGKTFAGNGGVMMIKIRDGKWKIAVFAKHDRFIDFFPVDEGDGDDDDNGDDD